MTELLGAQSPSIVILILKSQVKHGVNHLPVCKGVILEAEQRIWGIPQTEFNNSQSKYLPKSVRQLVS